MTGYLASIRRGRNKATLKFSNKSGIYQAEMSLPDALGFKQGETYQIPRESILIHEFESEAVEFSDDELEALTTPDDAA